MEETPPRAYPMQLRYHGGDGRQQIDKDRNSQALPQDVVGTRQRLGGGIITTVPTADARAGNLQAFLGDFICADGSTSSTGCASPLNVKTTEGQTVAARAGMVFDPNSGNPDGTGRQAISTGGQVNVLTPAPAMAKLLSNIPLPNFGAPGTAFGTSTFGVIGSANDGRVVQFGLKLLF